jgi:hypothetical protein
MLEIAKNTAANGPVMEEYTVYQGPDGDMIIDCRRRGASEGDSFHVPAQLCPWLSAVFGSMGRVNVVIHAPAPNVVAFPRATKAIPIGSAQDIATNDRWPA